MFAIKKQTETAVIKVQDIETTVGSLLEKQREASLLLAASIKNLETLLRSADEKIKVLTDLTAQRNSQSVIDTKLEQRLAAIEKKMAIYGESATPIPTAIASSSPSKFRTPKTRQVPSAKDEFPWDAMRFTFGDIKSVKYKKPYGIAIDGEIIYVEHWTSMLDEVIPYAFENYGINKVDLCNSGLGIHFSQTEYSEARTVSYFVNGVASSTEFTYRYLRGIDLSVISSGADKTVEVLKALLCDYLKIRPGNVELFYHKK